MFRDITGNIKPDVCFNIWRFSKYKHTYRLVDSTMIEVKNKGLLEMYDKITKTGFRDFFMLKEIGERVDDEVKKQGLDKKYDAWTMSVIHKWDTSINVDIDLFKKDRWYHKLLYKFKKTCVIDSKK